jgi:hypothetical protein
MTVVAHTGHVLIDLAVYLGPVAVIALLFKLAERRTPPEDEEIEQWPD